MTKLAARPREIRETPSPALQRRAIEDAVATACARIAPLWPLADFVAVNPFLGFRGQGFAQSCATLHRVARADMLMPRAFFRDAAESGRIADEDFAAAIAESPAAWRVPRDVAALRAALARDPSQTRQTPGVVATVAEILDRLAQGNRHVARTAFMVDEISKFCAAYFDSGQARWPMPWRDLPLYAAWRSAMRFDRNAEAMGIQGFRKAVSALPADPLDAIAAILSRLGIPVRAYSDYLHRALFDVGGWAAYCRRLDWSGGDGDVLVQLLAIRVVWGYALFLERTDSVFRDAWQRAMEDAAHLPDGEELDVDLALDLVAQDAYERAWQRRLTRSLAAAKNRKPSPERPHLQAAFCIDVRSEVYRRALEAVIPDAQTFGFAGFFGLAFDYIALGETRARAQYPVLIPAAFTICETLSGTSPADARNILARLGIHRRLANAWKAFKLSAVSSFAFVETAGLLSAFAIVRAALGRDGGASGTPPGTAPQIATCVSHDRRTGLDLQQRIDCAESILRGMSLTQNFARIVLLAGHGSTSVNNPYAAGLDCGACGGHPGDANARIAAAILNDREVRGALAARGISIGDDTLFVAALHDTTTDAVTLYDTDRLPASHASDIAQLRDDLALASSRARAERAVALGIAHRGGDVGSAIVARSRDWSQTRPEWGLAGNAAFIAAPRARTAGLDLAGRVFLHEYDWTTDSGFRILEQIMTAPMIVASWINLQYYGSTVNNRAFGSGNKVLHNVVGRIGVFEGNAGDLRTGLPWQSVHDGTRFVHEPMRLSVVIAAPVAAIDAILVRHDAVRELVENRWLHLFALTPDGDDVLRWAGAENWQSER